MDKDARTGRRESVPRPGTRLRASSAACEVHPGRLERIVRAEVVHVACVRRKVSRRTSRTHKLCVLVHCEARGS